MAQTYIKVLSETNISTDVPKTAIINGKFACGKLPEDYLNSIGFYRLVEGEMPEVEEGYHLEKRYSIVDNQAIQSWVAVENAPQAVPVKSYSKLKILLAAKQAGFIDALIQFLDSDPITKMIWDASNTIDDNALLNDYLPGIAEALKITPEKVMELLDANCIAD